MTKHIPQIYRPPSGGPLRWQDDISGILPEAVKAFFNQHHLEPVQVELLREYCEYYILAPCWRTDGAEAQFAQLRESVKHLQSATEIDAWIDRALEVGIDPF